MRWRATVIGDTRIVRRFAWFPVYTGSSGFAAGRVEMMWLEFYDSHEEVIQEIGWARLKIVPLSGLPTEGKEQP